jgi:hypothetical protein
VLWCNGPECGPSPRGIIRSVERWLPRKQDILLQRWYADVATLRIDHGRVWRVKLSAIFKFIWLPGHLNYPDFGLDLTMSVT